jgi:hypothetical protein
MTRVCLGSGPTLLGTRLVMEEAFYADRPAR